MQQGEDRKQPLDRLTCEETFRRLDDYVDRELEPAEMQIVRRHLETCAVCAREYDFETSVLHHLRAKLRRIAVPEDLQAKIHRQLGGAPEPPARE